MYNLQGTGKANANTTYHQIHCAFIKMIGDILFKLFNFFLILKRFLLWNLRNVRNPKSLFESILNVRRPTEPTVENVHLIFDVINYRCGDDSPKSNRDLTEDHYKSILRILSQCPMGEDILQVVDDDGYNLLQKAVIMQNIPLLRHLIKHGCDVNKGGCSPVLHLACKLGHTDIVALLLKHGARFDIEAGMCYPKAHSPVNQARSKFFFLDYNEYDCEKIKKIPLFYAVDSDNVELVKLFYSDKPASNRQHFLHYACNQGAFECMKLFVEIKANDINKANENGFTPLLYGVRFGYKFVSYLLNNGANIFACTTNQESVLHVVYSAEDAEDLYDSTKLLLGFGIEQKINERDVTGNTALHKLMSNLTDRMIKHSNKQKEMNLRIRSELLKCIDLLLRYNSDPTLLNNEGLTPLHVMLTMFYEKLHATTEADETNLYNAFDLLHDVLEIFLKNKMHPDLPSPGNRTPLMILLPQVLHIELSYTRLCCESKMRCLKLLCDYGANPNFTMATDGSCVSLLSQFASQIIRLRFHASAEMLREIKHANALHLNSVLTLLLRNGLNPNFTSNRRRPQMEAGSGNGLVEFVKLAQNVTQPKDFALIHMWILTLLQWSANPDMEPYPSEPIICQSQSSIFLKHNCTQPVNQYMLEIQDFNSWLDGGYAEELLLIFVNSMDHTALYQCLGSTKFMSRFNPNRAPSRKFSKMIYSLNSNPRSLKQMSRVAIYKAMERKLAGNVEQLPLPRLLQDYLLEVRP